jgi:hypothetical protein
MMMRYSEVCISFRFRFGFVSHAEKKEGRQAAQKQNKRTQDLAITYLKCSLVISPFCPKNLLINTRQVVITLNKRPKPTTTTQPTHVGNGASPGGKYDSCPINDANGGITSLRSSKLIISVISDMVDVLVG